MSDTNVGTNNATNNEVKTVEPVIDRDKLREVLVEIMKERTLIPTVSPAGEDPIGKLKQEISEIKDDDKTKLQQALFDLYYVSGGNSLTYNEGQEVIELTNDVVTRLGLAKDQNEDQNEDGDSNAEDKELDE